MYAQKLGANLSIVVSKTRNEKLVLGCSNYSLVCSNITLILANGQKQLMAVTKVKNKGNKNERRQ